MSCKKYRILASGYLDRQLMESEAAEYHTHLSECSGCRAYLVEIEQTSLLLKEIKPPAIPRELHSSIINSAARHSAKEITLVQQAFEWVLKLNPRPISYATGFIVSALLFGVLISVSKPIPVTRAATEQVAIFPIVKGSDEEYHSYNNLPPDEGEVRNDHYYELPRVLSDSALVSFSHIAYQKPGSDGMAAMVEIKPDGHAELIDVLQEPRDPMVIEELCWSLDKRTFQPATVGGRAVATRIVLLIEKVDIRG